MNKILNFRASLQEIVTSRWSLDFTDESDQRAKTNRSGKIEKLIMVENQRRRVVLITHDIKIMRSKS